MRICIVNDKFVERGGGGQFRIMGLARTLRGRGHDVVLLAPPPGLVVPPLGRMENEPAFALRRYWATTLPLANRLRRAAADAVILELPSPVLKGSLLFFERILDPRTPVFVDIGDYWVSDEDGSAYAFLSSRLMHSFVAHADGVAVATKGLQTMVQPWTDKDVLLVPCGVDFDQFDPGRTRPAHLPVDVGNRDVLVFSGTVSRFTGCDLIPGFAQDLVRLHENVLFVIVGTGPYLEPMIAEVRKRSLGEYFHFAGSVRHEDVPGYLKLAKIGVSFLPNRRDAVLGVFPMKIPEYMAMGCVPVVNALGENRWIVEDSVTGLCDLPENLPKRTADLLREAGTLARMSKEARRSAQKRFDWQYQAEYIESRWLKGAGLA